MVASGFASESSTGGVFEGALRCLGSRLPAQEHRRIQKRRKEPGTDPRNPPSPPVIKLFLLQIVPQEFIFLHVCPKLGILEQLQVMQSVWVADNRD